jgi:hypothetical protein
MPLTGTVNYHVHRDHRQAFEIDAGGVVGKLISPELATTEIPVLDTRSGQAAPSFERDSVGFATAASQVKGFSPSNQWQAIYDRELTDLLSLELGAKEVVIFDHTVREDDPNSDRKPARNVHSDYSQEGAEKRLIDILGVEEAAKWSQGHYAFINVWRPVDNPINSAPLGFVLPASVAPEDWILIDLVYPDRHGHIMGLAANKQHQWIYQSKMTPDEVAFFNIYDNRGRASIGHSAIDLIEDPSVTTIRKSIESRTLVRY